MQSLNYATAYQQALDQQWPYVLHFGALYNTPNNQVYRWLNAQTIQVPTISVRGRINANRDNITAAQRRYNNKWTPLTLTNHRTWDTLVHPLDIDETNQVASIANITRVFNEEEKFPEMDAYCISKLYAEYLELGQAAGTVELTTDNILSVFDGMMLKMSNKRVPSMGRILYVTPEVQRLFANAKEISRSRDILDGRTRISTEVTAIDNVQIVAVPPELMHTIYNFTEGWQIGMGAKQINMLLVHPSAVITPVKYEFAELQRPAALSQGKWVYFEESYEDVFILANKVDGVQFNIAE